MLVGFIATITSKLCSGFIMSFSYFAAAAALSVCSCAPVCVRSYGFLCSSCSQSHSIVFIFVNFVFQFASIVYVLHFVWRANFIRLRNGFASSSHFFAQLTNPCCYPFRFKVCCTVQIFCSCCFVLLWSVVVIVILLAAIAACAPLIYAKFIL